MQENYKNATYRSDASASKLHNLWSLPRSDDIQISLCTFVTDWVLYREMVARFASKGFKEGCEYVYVDNSEANVCSAFHGINEFFNRANGRIVIIVHQDVHAIDNFEVFCSAISLVYKLDPNWAVLGNAGFDSSFRSIRYLSSPSGYEQIVGDRNVPVESLDENFLVFNMSTRPSVSNDLSSFHLYGTDAVQIAKLRGLKSYVIGYHVDHFGLANLDNTFLESVESIEEKFSFKRRWFTIKTPVSYVAMGGPSLTAWRHKKKLARFIRTGQKRSPFVKFRDKILCYFRRFHLSLSGAKFLFNGKKYFVPFDAPARTIRAFAKGTYKVESCHFVSSYVDCDFPVVELGGSYGVVGSQIAKRLRGLQKHIIVEANPELVPILEKNIGGSLGRNTFIHNAILSYSAPLVELETEPGVNSSGISSGRSLAEGDSILTVATVTLEKLLSTREINGNYCLVCDIAGAEFELFESGREALERCVLAIIEFHPAAFAKLRKSTIEFFESIEASGLSIVERRGSVVVAKRILK